MENDGSSPREEGLREFIEAAPKAVFLYAASHLALAVIEGYSACFAGMFVTLAKAGIWYIAILLWLASAASITSPLVKTIFGRARLGRFEFVLLAVFVVSLGIPMNAAFSWQIMGTLQIAECGSHPQEDVLPDFMLRSN